MRKRILCHRMAVCRKNGGKRLVFFDEETGFMVKDTIVDGTTDIKTRDMPATVCATNVQNTGKAFKTVFTAMRFF